MVRDPLFDYLDAIAASDRRRLWLHIETAELLRMPRNRAQANRQEGHLQLAQMQIREQMRRQRRRRFRGDVSVEIDILAPDVRRPPSAPKSVKRYLDAMKGLVYADDSQVAHLAVQRLAEDDPRWRDSPRQRPESQPSVAVTVLPLRLYVANYDRAFRLHGKVEDDCDYDDRHEGREFWTDSWSSNDEMRLDALLEIRRDAESGTDYGLIDKGLLPRLADHFDRDISELRAKGILLGRPGPDDRPGARSPSRDPVSPERAARSWGMARYEMPGEFWLPLPPEARGDAVWSQAIRTAIANHRAHWQLLLPEAFDTDLSLDIAISGAGANARDIDNVAHDVLVAVEELFCRSRRGTVIGYRAYRSLSEAPGVRVRMMIGERIPQLAKALDAARWYVIARDPSERRY